MPAPDPLAVWRLRPLPADSRARPLRLALQGGGAYGAFTWGVLDALLESPSVSLDAASGASAGAVNAVLLAQGLAEGGAEPARPGGPSASVPAPPARERARAVLKGFWESLAESSPFERHRHWLLRGDPESPRLSPAANWMLDWATRFGPAGGAGAEHPLRPLLADRLDFERLRRASPLPLFVAATEVRTGTARVFREHELTLDALLASACLPRLHAPVEIDGEAFWDGGFSANPPLAPLVFDRPPAGHGGTDLLLVTLSPARVPLPDRPAEVARRQQEMAFAAPLQAEWRWIERLCAEATRDARRLPWLDGALQRRLAGLRLHRLGIDDPQGSDSTCARSVAPTAEGPLIASVDHVRALCDAGRAAAVAWLAARSGPVA